MRAFIHLWGDLCIRASDIVSLDIRVTEGGQYVLEVVCEPNWWEETKPVVYERQYLSRFDAQEELVSIMKGLNHVN